MLVETTTSGSWLVFFETGYNTKWLCTAEQPFVSRMRTVVTAAVVVCDNH